MQEVKKEEKNGAAKDSLKIPKMGNKAKKLLNFMRLQKLGCKVSQTKGRKKNLPLLPDS